MTTILQTYIKVKGFYRILIFLIIKVSFMEYSIARTESFLRSFLIKAEDLPDKDEAFVRRLELISVTEQSV